MAHDPEREVASFVGGDFDDDRQAAFSDHLLSCDRCWKEMQAAQRGRQLAESARTVTPAALRERVRAIVGAEQSENSDRVARWCGTVDSAGSRSRRPHDGRRRRGLMAAGTGVVLLAVAMTVGLLVGKPSGRGQEPRALSAAVADYRAHELPGRQLPTISAPDLSRLRLVPVGAGGGSYAGLTVDGYAYQDSAGRRLVLYLSQQPFPTAPGARRLEGTDGPWTARRGEVILLCARAPHAVLVVGQDPQLVRNVAAELGVL